MHGSFQRKPPGHLRKPFPPFRLINKPRPVRSHLQSKPRPFSNGVHQQHQKLRPNPINSIPQKVPTKKPVNPDSPDSLAVLLAQNSHFSQLHSALQRAGLLDTLNGQGPFTLFAPTNAAFDKVPKDSLSKLFSNKKALRSLLLRHVVPGANLLGKSVPDGSTSLTTASGEQLSAQRGKFVQVVSPGGQAFVVKFDFVGRNGVFHAIDQVL